MTRRFAMLAGALACVLGATCARAQQYPAPTLQSVLFSGWTTGGRPVSPAAGTMGYNTSLSQLEVWNGSAWISGSGLVSSVAGRTGAVTLATGDISGLGTIATQAANAVAITGGTAVLTSLTAATLASTNATTTLSVKNGTNGTVMALVGGSAADIEPKTDIVLPGGAWAVAGNLLNNTAPITQNATFTGTTTNAQAMFGIYLQQTDNSSNTGNGNGTYGIYDNLILGAGSVGQRGSGYFQLAVNAHTGNGNTHRDFTGLTGKCNMNVSDAVGSTFNSCFGFNAVGRAGLNVSALQIVGAEIDTWTETGSVVTDRIGMQVVDVTGGGASYGVQGTRDDVALSINNQYGPGAGLGYAVGVEVGRGGGNFPIATDGWLMAAQGNSGNAFTVAGFADMRLGNFTNFFQMSGASMDGSGTLRIGRSFLSDQAAGLKINAAGSIGTSATVAAGGSGYTASSSGAATDAYGGVWELTFSGGAVTAAALQSAPYVAGATPANPLALTSGRGQVGTGATINVTWATGSALTVAGGVNLNAASGLSLSATAGFVALPFTAGIPTGAPAANTNCAIDTTNGYLNCYYGAAWHKIAFAAGAG